MLAANSVVVSVRLADDANDRGACAPLRGRRRGWSWQMRMIWRVALASPAGGSRSLLRCAGELVADAADGAAQRALDPLGHGGEIGFAVERRKNGAAHQGRAADAGQDRAGKPLHRDAAAIDDAAGAAIDRKRRLIAEVERPRRLCARCVAARPAVIQIVVPCTRGAPRSVTQDARPDSSESAGSNRTEARCRAARVPVNDRHRTSGRTRMRRLTGLPLTIPARYCGKNDRGMWLKCGAAAPARACDRVKKWLKRWNRGECCGCVKICRFGVDNDDAAGPYNLAHTARRPLTARWRASEAPHL